MVKINKDNQSTICETDQFGSKYWILNGKLHRQDGPAIERIDGYKAWFLHGKRHRLDGPAQEFPDKAQRWYYHGKYINCSSQKEFERLIKLKALW